MTLDCQRDLFEIPDDISYLNCAYMSPQLRSVREAGVAAIGRKAQPWTITPADFFSDSEVARALFGRLIGADADGVALVPSVSYGLAVAAANVRVASGQRIVVLEDQFPSNVYIWRELAQQNNAVVVTVPRPHDHDWTSALLTYIDERTAVVAVPNCHWTDGSLVDLPTLRTRTREAGAVLVVDAIQSLGAYPLDVNVVQPDFLVATTYKWLLGPYSLGFLYVAPEQRNGQPIEHTWIGRAGSENFAGLVNYQDAFQPGARRFDVGERSNFTLLPMAIAALEQILAWGVPEIAATLSTHTALIEQEAIRLGLTPIPAARRAGHMIGVRMSSDVPPELPVRLAAAQVYVSVRGQSLRVSPHVYNTPADIERLFAVLATLV